MRRAAALALAGLSLSLAGTARGWWFASRDGISDARRLLDAGKYPEVVALLTPEAIQRLPGEQSRLAYGYLGTSYERLHQLDRALGVYQLGVRLFPNDINLLTQLATLLHRAGLEDQARPFFERVLHIHPNNAAAHLGLAEIDRSLGLLEDSASHFEKALDTMADQAPVWRSYAEVLLDQHETATAELAVRRSLELAPDPDSSVDLALIQRENGRLEEAIATLAGILARTPARSDVALTRALWLIEAARYDESREEVERVLKASPDHPLARWIRARLYLREDRYNLAVKDLESAAKAGREAPFTASVSASMLELLRARRPR